MGPALRRHQLRDAVSCATWRPRRRSAHRWTSQSAPEELRSAEAIPGAARGAQMRRAPLRPFHLSQPRSWPASWRGSTLQAHGPSRRRMFLQVADVAAAIAAAVHAIRTASAEVNDEGDASDIARDRVDPSAIEPQRAAAPTGGLRPASAALRSRLDRMCSRSGASFYSILPLNVRSWPSRRQPQPARACCSPVRESMISVIWARCSVPHSQSGINARASVMPNAVMV